MQYGKVVVLEGVNGVGKTFIYDKILTFLTKECGKKVCGMREPGGTPFGEEIARPILKNKDIRYSLTDISRFHLFMASRSMSAKYILDNRSKFDFFILDRFSPSTLAYNFRELNFDFDTLYKIEKEARLHLIPDYTIYLHGSTEMIVNRLYDRDYAKTVGNDGDLSLDIHRKMAEETDLLKVNYGTSLKYLENKENWKIQYIPNAANSLHAFNQIKIMLRNI